ncbi:MAG: response regulator [Proteobacteria bacterium]|nr:response regulator [Pseudomonadota bacterium]MBU1710019.1 response regulator [Pseudomonadota bacterium]
MKAKYLSIIISLAFLLVVFLPVYTIFYIAPSFSDLLAQQTEDEAVRVADHMAESTFKGDHALKDMLEDDDRLADLKNLIVEFKLMKLKVFAPNGEIVFSTDDKDIGTINTHDYFHEIVAKGGAYTKIVQKDEISLEGQKVSMDVVETYVPIMRNGRFYGAFEIYYDITARKKQQGKLVRQLTIISSALAFCLLLAVVFSSMKAISSFQQLIKTQKDLKIERDRAEEASRVKSSFLASMSHEIRTPMNGILGMVELTLGTELSHEQRDFLEAAYGSGEALLTIINDILDFSKIEAGKMELETVCFDLDELLKNIVKPMGLLAEAKNLSLSFSRDQRVSRYLKGDPGRLRQVLVNLTGNAIKFTEQGRIVISVSPVTGGSADLGNGIEKILFSVIDTGIGIPREKLESIFESFTQADGSTTRKYGGTGLGLTISKRITEIMGGDIGVKSEPGKGSTFYFTACLETGEPIVVDTKPVDAKILVGRLVLIVDDNVDHRTILKGILQRNKMIIVEASSADEALDVLTGQKNFDLMLVDIDMPEKDGFELVRQIREERRLNQIHIVMVTGIGFRGDVAHASKLGIEGYLTKPVKGDELLKVLTMLLALEHPKDGRVLTKHSEHPLDAKKFKILLAEDNAVNSKLACHLLKRQGYDYVAVENGIEALEALKKDSFDLILMDVQMPEMDGLQATRRIREAGETAGFNPKIPIIALTAHAMQGDKERFIEAGMDDYLAKPMKVEGLVDIIEKYRR